MTEKSDGGPAFPQLEAGNSDERGITYFACGASCGGMSLRVWLAAMTLQGRLAAGHWRARESFVANEVDVAFKIADAMIERSKQ